MVSEKDGNVKSVSVFLLLYIILFHDFLFHNAGKPFFRMGGSSFAHTTQRSSLFCFGRGLMYCSRAGLRRTTIFSVQKEQKNAILLLLFNILCRKTFVLAFLSKTLDYSQRLCYNSIRDFVSWFVMQKNRKATKNPSRCIRTERFWRN